MKKLPSSARRSWGCTLNLRVVESPGFRLSADLRSATGLNFDIELSSWKSLFAVCFSPVILVNYSFNYKKY